MVLVVTLHNIVSNIICMYSGSDMYMAFGVKTEDSDLNTGKTQVNHIFEFPSEPLI